jgi:prepilin-type N-terminal cleavage/methylation domain-containing protein
MKTLHVKGFTLIEMLIALAIASMILGVAFSLTMTNRRLLVQDRTLNDISQNLQAAAEIMSDDIRLAGADLGSPPSQMPIIITANSLVLARDLDPNPTSAVIETRTYQYDATTKQVNLTVTVASAGATTTQGPDGVINNVSAMNITVTRQDGTTASTLGDSANISNTTSWTTIRSVNIELTGTIDINGKQVQKTLRTTIFPRNVLSQ